MQKSVRKAKPAGPEAPRYPSRSKDPLQAGVNPLEVVHQLRFSLEQEWKSKSIPYALCEIYSGFISLLPHRKSVIFMQKELSDLRSYNSLVQVCLKGIHAREESLLSIKEMCDYLSKANDWETLSDIRVECAEILHAHRMLTLNVVESIERWKEFFLFENPDFKANFVYNGFNYLEKIRHDLNFLPTSELSKAFKFSTESDPFLIQPSKVIEKHKSKLGGNYFIYNGQVIIPLPSLILKRVQKMDEFVKQEAGIEVMTQKLIEKPAEKTTKIKSNAIKPDDLSLAKRIAEGIYRELITAVTLEVAQRQVDEYVAKMLSFDIEPVLGPCLQAIVAEVLREITQDGRESVMDDGVSQKYDSSRPESYEKSENQNFFDGRSDFERKSQKYQEMDKSDRKEKSSDSDSSDEKRIEHTSFSRNDSEKIEKNEMKKIKDLQEKKGFDEKTFKDQLHLDEEHKQKTNNFPTHQSSAKPVSQYPATKAPQETESERRSTQNAKRLQQFSMIEWIIRNMIENLILEADFESIVNSSIKSILSEKSKKANNEEKRRLTIIVKTLESEKLNELIFQSLIENFVELEWLEQLALSLINLSRNPNRRKTFEPLLVIKPDLFVEEADDFALDVFTPGVHSPNQVLSEDSEEDTPAKASHTSDMLNKIISQGRMDGKYELVPFDENLKSAFKSFDLYLKNLSGKVKEINWHPEKVFEILQYCEDCCWFWLKDETEITGCLVYSTTQQSGKKSGLVHHFSTVNPRNMRILLDKSQKLMSSHSCKNMIFNLKCESSKEISSLLLNISLESLLLSFPPGQKQSKFFYLDFPENFSFSSPVLTFNLKIISSTTLSLSGQSLEPKAKANEEMKRIGNRHCTLDAILAVLEKDQLLSESAPPTIRLQGDLLDILEIISTTEDFKYPYLVQTRQGQSSSSSLCLDLRFLNISSFTKVHDKVPYKFLKFLNVRSFKSEQYSYYEIDTNISSISAFFLVYLNLEQELSREIKGCKSDLFGKIENLLKNLPENNKSEDLVLPGFGITVDWHVEWIKGLCLERAGWIAGCNEKVEVRMEFTEPAPVSLKTSDCVTITGDFVFGLREKYLTQVLELPFFVSLITKSDWLLS